MSQVKYWEEYSYYLLTNLQNERKGKFRSDFFALHRSDQVAFYQSLQKEERKRLYQYLQADEFAMIFAKLTIEQKHVAWQEIEPSDQKTVIHCLPSDELVQMLKLSDSTRRQSYLAALGEGRRREVELLLRYEDGSAAAMMTTEFVTASRDDKVEEVLQNIFSQHAFTEAIYYVYVVSADRELIGVSSLRDLLSVPKGHTMDFLMKRHVISVPLEAKEEEVFQIMRDYDLLSLPVVNDKRELLGIITVDDALDIPRSSSLRQGPIKWHACLSSLILMGLFMVVRQLVESPSQLILILFALALVAGSFISLTLEIRAVAWKGKDLMVSFGLAILVSLLANALSMQLVDQGDWNLPFLLALFLAIVSNVLTGMLLPYIYQSWSRLSNWQALLSNMLLTSFFYLSMTFLFLSLA